MTQRRPVINRLGGTRTLNAQFEPRILSPLRLPIPPRAQNLTLPTPEGKASLDTLKLAT